MCQTKPKDLRVQLASTAPIMKAARAPSLRKGERPAQSVSQPWKGITRATCGMQGLKVC
jgi:hypothetical protein